MLLIINLLSDLKKTYDKGQDTEEELLKKLSKLENKNRISDYIFSIVCGIAVGLGFYTLQIIGNLMNIVEGTNGNLTPVITFMFISVIIVCMLIYAIVKRYVEGTKTKFIIDYEVELIKKKLKYKIES